MRYNVKLTEDDLKLLGEFCSKESVYIDTVSSDIPSFLDLFEEELIHKKNDSPLTATEEVDGDYILTKKGKTFCEEIFSKPAH